jgi:hypothetical protein
MTPNSPFCRCAMCGNTFTNPHVYSAELFSQAGSPLAGFRPKSICSEACSSEYVDLVQAWADSLNMGVAVLVTPPLSSTGGTNAH